MLANKLSQTISISALDDVDNHIQMDRISYKKKMMNSYESRITSLSRDTKFMFNYNEKFALVSSAGISSSK